jgi:ATP-dependent DNA ligase
LLWDAIAPAEKRLQFSRHVEGDGTAFFRAVENLKIEGMVSKSATSCYRSGASRTWLKMKCFTESEFEVVRLLRKRGQAPFALMASRESQPKYVGSAIIALNKTMSERLWDSVSETKAKNVKVSGAQPVKPGLVGRVRHLTSEDKHHTD